MRTLFDSHQNYGAEYSRVSALNSDYHGALRCVAIAAANIDGSWKFVSTVRLFGELLVDQFDIFHAAGF